MINRGNRILIVVHLYCCSKHKLSTILIASVATATIARLVRFDMITFWFKTLFKYFCVFYSIFLYNMIGLPLSDTVSTNLAQ